LKLRAQVLPRFESMPRETREDTQLIAQYIDDNIVTSSEAKVVDLREQGVYLDDLEWLLKKQNYKLAAAKGGPVKE
jgi:hypothetical protein